jgi:hypothetical protein
MAAAMIAAVICGRETTAGISHHRFSIVLIPYKHFGTT